MSTSLPISFFLFQNIHHVNMLYSVFKFILFLLLIWLLFIGLFHRPERTQRSEGGIISVLKPWTLLRKNAEGG